jgi:predicted ATP-binding protein involved in virulence
MTPNSLLRLDRLSLRNFRCFAECTVDLHPKLTVLVAENGQGKTAILDAIGIALGLFVDTVAGTRQSPGFERSDVRLAGGNSDDMRPVLPTEFSAEGQFDGRPLQWSRTLKSYDVRARTSTKDAESLRQAATDLRGEIDGPRSVEVDPSDITLPLVAFYGTGRLWNEHRLTKGRKAFAANHEQFSGYVDCLSSSSSFKGMLAWFENKMNEIGDARFSGDLRKNVPLFNAVKEATRVVLEPTGWCQLDWDPERRHLVVGHATYGRLPLSALSDGVRNMIALVADIARRCASLNPDLREDAARRTPGILLIDEVDMHLHPRWQQLVVGLLQEAFPEMQMVLTTHSPHVLSTVEVDSIRVISLANGHGTVEVPAFQTRGVQSANILSQVMDVHAVPPVEEAAWLSEYRALVQMSDEDSSAGRSLWSKLVAHFGEDHSVMAEVAVLRRLQEFRRKSVPRQGGN